MTVARWDTIEFIWGQEVTAHDVADYFLISIIAAHNRLKRAHDSGWLNRRKFEGVYWYSWGQKTWDFFQKYGSFINQPWYGWGKNP